MSTPDRVLLVEDDEGLGYAFRVALERAGFAVDLARDGREAVRMLDASGPSYCAVVLDMILPHIHGSSVVAHIARTVPKLAVVAVTGFPDRVLFADPGDRHVVKAIFAKPVQPEDVAAYLRSRAARKE